MEYELQFRIMANTNSDSGKLLMILKHAFEDLTQDRDNSCTLRGNRIEVIHNEDSDHKMADDPDDGYLYFPYLIGVYPITDDVNLNKQIQLAKSLSDVLNMKHVKTEIVADFEELL